MRKYNSVGKWKALAWVMISMFCALQVSAQQTVRTIRGKIISAVSGSPITGATITVIGTKNAVTSDDNGNYSIMANNGETLLVTFVGYKQKQATVTERPKYHKFPVERKLQPFAGCSGSRLWNNKKI